MLRTLHSTFRTTRNFSKMALKVGVLYCTTLITMADLLKTLGPKQAAELDQELMSESGGFSIDQLMELAGLSVSQAGRSFKARIVKAIRTKQGIPKSTKSTRHPKARIS